MRNPKLQTVILLAACSWLSISGCATSTGLVTSAHFHVEYAVVSESQAQELAHQAMRTGIKAADFLGATLRGPITIKIDPYQDIPFTTRDGTILLPVDRVANRRSAVTHEIIHVIARSIGKSDRFLDEGLGVYMQERFGEDPSYPNFGRELHRETVRLAGGIGYLIPLVNVEATRLASKGGTERQLAYLQEGSFVKYLIERYGIGQFMTMYKGLTYEATYGKPITELEQEWKNFLKSLR